MLQRIMNLLGIENQQEVISEIIKLTTEKVLTYLRLNEVPKSLEWIIVEMSIARFNRIGSEGVTSESVEGRQTTYTDELAPYLVYLDDYIKANSPKKGYKLL